MFQFVFRDCRRRLTVTTYHDHDQYVVAFNTSNDENDAVIPSREEGVLLLCSSRNIVYTRRNDDGGKRY